MNSAVVALDTAETDSPHCSPELSRHYSGHTNASDGALAGAALASSLALARGSSSPYGAASSLSAVGTPLSTSTAAAAGKAAAATGGGASLTASASAATVGEALHPSPAPARRWLTPACYTPTPPSSFAVAVSIVPEDRFHAAPAVAGARLPRSHTHAAFGSSPSLAATPPPQLVGNRSFTKSFDCVSVMRHAATAVMANSGLGGNASMSGSMALGALGGSGGGGGSRGGMHETIAGALTNTGGGAGTKGVPSSVDTYRVHLLLRTPTSALANGCDPPVLAGSPSSSLSFALADANRDGDGGDGRKLQQVVQVRARWRQFQQLLQFVDSIAPSFEPPPTPAGFPFPIERGKSYVQNSRAFAEAADTGGAGSECGFGSPMGGGSLNTHPAPVAFTSGDSGAAVRDSSGTYGGVVSGASGTDGSGREEVVVSPSRREERRAYMEAYLNAALATASVNCLNELQTFVGYHIFLRNEQSQFEAAAAAGRQRTGPMSVSASPSGTTTIASAAATTPAVATTTAPAASVAAPPQVSGGSHKENDSGGKGTSSHRPWPQRSVDHSAFNTAPLVSISLHPHPSATATTASQLGSSASSVSVGKAPYRRHHRHHRGGSHHSMNCSGLSHPHNPTPSAAVPHPNGGSSTSTNDAPSEWAEAATVVAAATAPTREHRLRGQRWHASSDGSDMDGSTGEGEMMPGENKVTNWELRSPKEEEEERHERKKEHTHHHPRSRVSSQGSLAASLPARCGHTRDSEEFKEGDTSSGVTRKQNKVREASSSSAMSLGSCGGLVPGSGCSSASVVTMTARKTERDAKEEVRKRKHRSGRVNPSSEMNTAVTASVSDTASASSSSVASPSSRTATTATSTSTSLTASSANRSASASRSSSHRPVTRHRSIAWSSTVSSRGSQQHKSTKIRKKKKSKRQSESKRRNNQNNFHARSSDNHDQHHCISRQGKREDAGRVLNCDVGGRPLTDSTVPGADLGSSPDAMASPVSQNDARRLSTIAAASPSPVVTAAMDAGHDESRAPPLPSPPPTQPQPPTITDEERVMLGECFRMLDVTNTGTVTMRHSLLFWVCAVPRAVAEFMQAMQPHFLGDNGTIAPASPSSVEAAAGAAGGAGGGPLVDEEDGFISVPPSSSVALRLAGRPESLPVPFQSAFSSAPLPQSQSQRQRTSSLAPLPYSAFVSRARIPTVGIGEWGTARQYERAIGLLPPEVLALPRFCYLEASVDFSGFLAVLIDILQLLSHQRQGSFPLNSQVNTVHAASTTSAAPTASGVDGSSSEGPVSVAAWVDAFWVLQYCRVSSAIELLQHAEETLPLRAKLAEIRERALAEQLARYREGFSCSTTTAAAAAGVGPAGDHLMRSALAHTTNGANPLPGLDRSDTTFHDGGNSTPSPLVHSASVGDARASSTGPAMGASGITTTAHPRAGSHVLDETVVLPLVLPAVAEALLSPANPTLNGFDIVELLSLLYVLCEGGVRLIDVEEVLTWVGLRDYSRDISFTLEELASMLDCISRTLPFSELLRCLRARPEPIHTATAAPTATSTTVTHSTNAAAAASSKSTAYRTAPLPSAPTGYTTAGHREERHGHDTVLRPGSLDSVVGFASPSVTSRTTGPQATAQEPWRQKLAQHVTVLKLISQCALVADPIATAAVQDRVIEHSRRIRGGICAYCDAMKEALRVQGRELAALTRSREDSIVSVAQVDAAALMEKDHQLSERSAQLAETRKQLAGELRGVRSEVADAGTVTSAAVAGALAHVKPTALSPTLDGSGGTTMTPLVGATATTTTATTPAMIAATTAALWSEAAVTLSSAATAAANMAMLAPRRGGRWLRMPTVDAGPITYSLMPSEAAALPGASFPAVVYFDIHPCREPADSSPCATGALSVVSPYLAGGVSGGWGSPVSFSPRRLSAGSASRRERISLRDDQGRCLAALLLDSAEGTVTVLGAARPLAETVHASHGRGRVSDTMMSGDATKAVGPSSAALSSRGGMAATAAVGDSLLAGSHCRNSVHARHTHRADAGKSIDGGNDGEIHADGGNGDLTAASNTVNRAVGDVTLCAVSEGGWSSSVRRRNLLFPTVTAYDASEEWPGGERSAWQRGRGGLAELDAGCHSSWQLRLQQRRQRQLPLQQPQLMASAAPESGDVSRGRSTQVAFLRPFAWYRVRLAMNWVAGSFRATISPLSPCGSNSVRDRVTTGGGTSSKYSESLATEEVSIGPAVLDFTAFMLDGAGEVEGLATIDVYPRTHVLYAYSNVCAMFDMS